MANITTTETKNARVPFKALTEEVLNAQVANFTQWLENLLGVKETTENIKRITVLLKYIKEHAWGLTLEQTKEAFEMYVEGKLSVEPMSGFIDVTHFNRVINAYKEIKSIPVDRKSVPYKINDHYLKYKTLQDKDGKPVSGVLETFDYLKEVGVLPSRQRGPKTLAAYEKMMMIAGGKLLAPLLDERKKLYNEGVKNAPRYRDLQMEIQSIRKQNHPALLPKFKQLVLESFFKKQTRHLREIL